MEIDADQDQVHVLPFLSGRTERVNQDQEYREMRTKIRSTVQRDADQDQEYSTERCGPRSGVQYRERVDQDQEYRESHHRSTMYKSHIYDYFVCTVVRVRFVYVIT